MRIRCLQHVPFEDAANIARWATDRGHDLARTCLYEGQPLPDPHELDWLVVVGGPMNIYEHGAYPWLVEEKAHLLRCLEAGKTVLGVCLGAQMLADALGGRVAANAHKEIGWHRVRLTEQGAALPVFAGFPPEFLAFHWHGDTFTIPPGATAAASSDACANQAFVSGRAVGLQFHLDYSADSIARMIAHCSDELVTGPYIQPSEELLAHPHRIEAARLLLYRLLDNLARQTPGPE
jgi:GMP synthase-like glutamine amidotransferase